LLSTLPRKLWLLVCALGVVLAAVFALLPVGTDFGSDPLLRLRQLDPVLSPPDTTAVCGSPLRTFNSKPEGGTLYELARNNACRSAARRRLLIALALGAAIVMVGLLGLAAARDPALMTGFGYPWSEGNVGRGRPETARSG
jgi:HEAT repeat protein